MRTLFFILLPVLFFNANASFTENSDLWLQIDSMNKTFLASNDFNSQELENLFQQAVEVVVSNEFAMQFEDLREDAFNTDNFDLCFEYVDRAFPLINVFILGDYNAIGVNTSEFFEKADESTEAYKFFLVSVAGFYIDGESLIIGTAEFPAWLIMGESEFQGSIDIDQAQEWLSFWQTIKQDLDGYFLLIAEETILGLRTVSEL